MKQKLLLLFAVLTTAVSASAYDFKAENDDGVTIYYNITSSSEPYTCKVTYQKYENYTYSSDYTGEINIPSTVKNGDTEYSVTEIGYSAFYGCSGLTSVTIPDGVTTIGDNAFYGTALYNNESNWKDNVLYIGNHLIKANSEIEGEYTIKEGTLTIANKAFYQCTGMTSVTIPNSVTSIAEYAFYSCSGLTSVMIGNNVETIGEYAFYGCSLTSVTIPNSVETIGRSAFNYCKRLTSLTIGNSVTSIGNYAFAQSKLTKVTIPSSVTSIGNNAFYNCTSLKEVTSLATTPPTLYSDCFKNIANDYTIKVPNISVSAYQGATNWITYKENISALNRSEKVTISGAGLATLWLEYDATIPDGAEVYYASSCSDLKVTITKISGTVLPRETGVIVKGTASGSCTFKEADTEGTKLEGDNLLVGSAIAQTLNDANYYKLTYSNEGNNFGFYLDNSNGTIVTTPHRAYLRLTKSSSRGISIDWGDGTTEIEGVVERKADGNTMYNLQGMPVGKGYKGIVVKGGRKIMMK